MIDENSREIVVVEKMKHSILVMRGDLVGKLRGGEMDVDKGEEFGVTLERYIG